MELAPLAPQASPSFSKDGGNFYFAITTRQTKCFLSSALPETAASVLIASVAVGTAATLLARNIKASQTATSSLKVCEDCGGSGICAECNGEGFILKKISDESAEKARMAAKSFRRNGPTAPNALQLGLAVLAEDLGELADSCLIVAYANFQIWLRMRMRMRMARLRRFSKSSFECFHAQEYLSLATLEIQSYPSSPDEPCADLSESFEPTTSSQP
ncbi:hypothetical protein ACMD2_01384 [Ananas comosus]|uniref:DUF7895 domain-containing protein n=1 Tax=Ananas comosus TaxID=4615 RepID=A0A199VG62_ANACO|nr:hypothetical protein ACMD2_01384 [Ananas comosus]